jgi:hypothetical protein
MNLSKENQVCYKLQYVAVIFCENWGSFWKEYFLQITDYKVEKGSFFSIGAYSAEQKKHMYLS